jgi:protein-S-isoprenylcysteine O-methyltransferase Ste14
MYLGMTLILIGVALGLGTLSPWLVIPMFVLSIQERFIKMEERKMESEFGAEYLAYEQKVRRWL